jgi:hypothetical protein
MGRSSPRFEQFGQELRTERATAELKPGDIVLIEAGAGVGITVQIAAQRSISSQAQKPAACVYCIAAQPAKNQSGTECDI